MNRRNHNSIYSQKLEAIFQTPMSLKANMDKSSLDIILADDFTHITLSDARAQRNFESYMAELCAYFRQEGRYEGDKRRLENSAFNQNQANAIAWIGIVASLYILYEGAMGGSCAEMILGGILTAGCGIGVIYTHLKEKSINREVEQLKRLHMIYEKLDSMTYNSKKS